MRLFAIALLLVLGVPVLLAGLTLLGTPGSCVAREATTEDRAVLPNWDAFLRQAAVTPGGAATLPVSEAQATVLASRALAGQGLPVSDVRVRFCPDGQVEVAARVTLLGWPVDALARAGIDASGGTPRATVSALRVGALPSFMTSWVGGLLLGGATRDLPLPPGATVRIEDGRAVLSGTLRP